MPAKDPSVQLTQDLLQEYSSARSAWFKQASEDNEFRAGKQWSTKQVNSLRDRNQEPVVVNVILPAVEQAKALLTANKPRFQATARENSDIKTAKAFSDLMTYIWDNSSGNMELKQAIDDYYVKGMGALMAYYDPHEDFGKGEIFLRSINPFDLYLDPSCKSPFASDSTHMIVAKRIMRSQLKNLYPDYADIIDRAQETSYIAGSSTSRFGLFDEQLSPQDISQRQRVADNDVELEVMDRYTKIRKPLWHCYDPYSNEEKILTDRQYEAYLEEPAFIVTTPDGKKEIVTEKTQVANLLGIYDSMGMVFHTEMDEASGQQLTLPGEDPNGQTTVSIQGITKKLLEKRKEIVCNNVLLNRIVHMLCVGDERLYEHELPVDTYPIVTLMNGFHRNPYPQSDVRIVRGLQEYINKIRSLIVAHASSSTNVKLLIPRGSMDKQRLEEEWARAGTAVIEFDPELGQPIVAGPVPLPNELYKNEADAKADVERILGIYAMMQGQAEGAPQTYKGTIALDEYGQRRIKSKRDDIEDGVNQLAKVIVQMIQTYYTETKIVRLINPNMAPSEISINYNLHDQLTGEVIEKINDVTTGKYDVIVITGSTLPSNRWARFEYYMQLYQTGIIDQIEVLKQTDVADVEGVLKRKDMIMQLQGQLQQASEEIKKLKGDLQTAQRESLHDKKRVEVKEFEKKLAKAEAKAEMTATLFQSRAGDELKKLKEETKAAEKEAKRITPL